MVIDKMIEKWEEKHSSLLNEYSKGNANNEVMQMYRSQMKNVLDFINDLKEVKIFASKPVLAVSLPMSGFTISVMENNIVTQDGKAVMLLSSRDYKEYAEKLKGNDR